MYSATLLDHFQNPRHAGEVTEPTTRIRVENPVCGDILELTATISNGILTSVRFRAKGCVPAMACSSALCELSWGKPVEDLKRISTDDVASHLDGIPQASSHAAKMAIEALQQLIRHAQSFGASAG